MRWLLNLLSVAILAVCTPASFAQTDQVHTSAAVSGLRTALIIRINFSDAQVACSSDQMADLMWRKTPSVTGLFEASSFGKFSIQSDTNQDGAPDVVSVTLNQTLPTTCSWTLLNEWSAAALQQVTAQGIDPNLFQYKIFVLPESAACGPGHSRSNGATEWYVFIKYCGAGDLIAHEIGHHLGMDHAKTDTNNDGTADSEYGDTSCIMGYSLVGWRHFNALHKRLVEWIPESGEVVGQIGSSYRLLAVEQDPSSGSLIGGSTQLIKVPIPGNEQAFYYLSLRMALDPYSSKLPYPSRVHLHRIGSNPAITHLIATIGAGETFVDSNNLGFTVSDVSPPYASVVIANVTATPQPTSTPSATPTRTVTIALKLQKQDNKPLKLKITNLDNGAIAATKNGTFRKMIVSLVDGNYTLQLTRKGSKPKKVNFVVSPEMENVLKITWR